MAPEDSQANDVARRARALGAATDRLLAARAELRSPARIALCPDDEVAELANLRRELELIELRTAARALEIGIIGQLNAGKSTLLNALAGRSLAPTSALPATGVFLRLDPRAKAPRVVFLADRRRRPLALAGAAEAERWITHDGNPRNHEGVDCVELPLEATFLGPDAGLTDTPGEGDVLQAEPERLQRYLDERLDIALLVGSSASIWTRASFDLLERALRRCPLVLLVANVDAGARNVDEQGETLPARDDERLLARLGERLAESPRAPRALADGSLRVHVLSARAALAGVPPDAAALERLRGDVRSAAEDPLFQRRRRAVLEENFAAAERALRELASSWHTRGVALREREAREREERAARAQRRADHRARAVQELEARAEDLVRGAQARAREAWEGDLSSRVLRSLRAWRVRRDAASALLEEVDREVDAASQRLDEAGAAAHEEARSFAALLVPLDPPSAAQSLAPLAPAPRTSFEALLGSPRLSGRFWLGLPFGAVAGYFAAGPATRRLESWIDVPIAGDILSAILGLLVALIAGCAAGALAGAWAWRRLLRAGLPVLVKRLLVAGVDERRLRAIGAGLVQRASARAEERARAFRAATVRALRAEEEADRQIEAEVPIPPEVAAADQRFERALEELQRC